MEIPCYKPANICRLFSEGTGVQWQLSRTTFRFPFSGKPSFYRLLFLSEHVRGSQNLTALAWQGFVGMKIFSSNNTRRQFRGASAAS